MLSASLNKIFPSFLPSLQKGIVVSIQFNVHLPHVVFNLTLTTDQPEVFIMACIACMEVQKDHINVNTNLQVYMWCLCSLMFCIKGNKQNEVNTTKVSLICNVISIYKIILFPKHVSFCLYVQANRWYWQKTSCKIRGTGISYSCLGRIVSVIAGWLLLLPPLCLLSFRSSA